MMQVNRNPEYFLEVAREKSISKAAEKLYISQPYLSQYIIRLEESFHVKLLDRDRSPLELTPAGQIYASYLESSIQMYRKLTQDLDALAADREQILRIGLSNWRSGALLPGILPAFSAQNPQIRLELLEVPNRSLYELISADKVDFVIMNTGLGTPDYVTSEVILNEKILLVGHKENPTVRKLVQMKQEGKEPDYHLLEPERMIMLRPESALAARVINWLDKKHVVLQNVIYTDNATTSLNLAAQNYGFCFLNETGTQSAPNREALEFFDLESDDMIHPLCVVYKKKSYLNPVAREFINMTVSFFKTYLDHDTVDR